ncbi:hypothetical protein Tco_0918411, partial [Tanacetum coccineum]
MRNLSLRILPAMPGPKFGLRIAIIELIKNMAFAAWFQVPSAMASSTSTLQWNDNTLMQLKPTSNTFAIVLADLRAFDLIAAVSISSGNNCPEMSIMTVTDLQLIEYNMDTWQNLNVDNAYHIGAFLYVPIGQEIDSTESQQLDQLSLLLDMVILSNMDDRWFWDLNGDGVFQVKDVRSMLDEAFLPKIEVPTRWIKSIPIK